MFTQVDSDHVNYLPLKVVYSMLFLRELSHCLQAQQVWFVDCAFVFERDAYMLCILVFQPSLSLPSTPPQRRRASSMCDVTFSIHHQGITGQLHGPIIEKKKSKPRPSLGNNSLGIGIDNPLPYADDSQAVTPSSVDCQTVLFDYSNLDSNGSSHPFNR